ncbi:hydrogenase/urease nickel incorporation protein HypA [Candidatus Sulfurimonas marisnigri]|uniref:Hydrogenase maturation factor HypA n=2 Tax=Sulfurimonas TaxID=202746 RepID=A0A7S7RPV4_9BACT|nr:MULTISPECIES: hydrogenase/urease nickel incorporation protein HypA [Sulfurimonas]QOY52784.1 hydrogenase/urease nickel incorporation protein HypA [Candidatus Sulfurimonas baltica]QOY53969.1 hydrogenase/urease nickel incorporation protein HypA [Candidatus Sulfurimonas marisnigri]
MHEYSIVQSLLDSCDENAKANNATKVIKVVIKIGVMSGVEPELLKTAFDTFKEQTICEDAEFIINIQSVIVKCNSCLIESTLKKLEYTCPKCKSTELSILDGEDMYLMQLELE